MNTEKSRTKHHSGADRRQMIALAARALLAEKGFEGLRTRDVAERVGINIATLHHHVATKEALVELVAETIRDEFAAIRQQNSRTGLSTIERLLLEFADFRTTRRENAEMIAALAELYRRATRDENTARQIQFLRQRWYEIFSAIFEDGGRDGSFCADINPQAAAAITISALLALDRDAQLPSPGFEAIVRELLRSFLSPTFKEKHGVPELS